MSSRTPPKEIEVSAKIRVNGKRKNDQKQEEEEIQPLEVRTHKSHEIARQENKEIPAGRRFEVLKVQSDGFLQSLIIAWNSSATVPIVNIQLNLGRNGAFNVDFDEYFEAGLDTPHSAQDFWISKRDDTNFKYAIVMTPSFPIEFNGLRIIITNKNTTSLTVSLAQLKYYHIIKQKS